MIIPLVLLKFILTTTQTLFYQPGINKKSNNLKTIFFFLLTGLLSHSLQAQQTFEFSHWKYSNGLNSKQRKLSSQFEKYDADNLLVERANNFYNDSFYDRTIYVYNNKKQKIAEEDYVRTNKLVMKKNYEYNDIDLLQLMYWKGRNKVGDSLTWREQYFYDAAGQLVKMIESSDGHYSGLTHLYHYENKGGRKIVTESILMEGKKKVKKIITSYNNKGLIIKIAHNGFNYMTDVIYDYEYDAEGNWVKRKACERQSRISPWIWTGEYLRQKVEAK